MPRVRKADIADPEKSQAHVLAHDHSIRNCVELLASEKCGCFYCLAIFPPSEIERWVDERDGNRTALCPHCAIDSVIGSVSGYPITTEFLAEMRRHWFGVEAD